MGFVKVAVTTDISVGTAKKVVAGGKDILLSNIDGSYYAISNTCPHMGGSLSEGTLEGGIITCPRHGSKFDVKTGKVVANGKLFFISFKVKDDQSYLVKLEGNNILVEVK